MSETEPRSSQGVYVHNLSTLPRSAVLPDRSVPQAGCSFTNPLQRPVRISQALLFFESCGEALDATIVLAASRNASMTQRARPRVWRSSGPLCRTTARTFATPGTLRRRKLGVPHFPGPSKDSSQLQDKDLPELERKKAVHSVRTLENGSTDDDGDDLPDKRPVKLERSGFAIPTTSIVMNQ
ncbi:hypothetical protein HPB51_012826 [Rhipicephalus microplus]|uniref:Uncharacterized protein n=1 Tax=Rhipicephalus microplus TaxID=6941 RepID=A0A9J6E9V7_RHIMP|nr:hypothetical protein HPB51_012826 [Rhipicephalus microplus]